MNEEADVASSTGLRRYEAEELELVCGPLGRGDIERLAIQLGRFKVSLTSKRRALKEAARNRAATGAFLPDDGVPYRARFLRLMREAGVS